MYLFQLLPPIKYPLAGKYYQAHGMSGRVSSNNIVTIARNNGDIVGVARLAPINDYKLLTGVHVDKQHRGLGVASELINLLTYQQTVAYSFAFSHLQPFYEQLGFQLITPDCLPCELAQRFNAYVKQGRKIIAMIRRIHCKGAQNDQ